MSLRTYFYAFDWRRHGLQMGLGAGVMQTEAEPWGEGFLPAVTMHAAGLVAASPGGMSAGFDAEQGDTITVTSLSLLHEGDRA